MRMIGPIVLIALLVAALGFSLRVGLEYGIANAISIAAGSVSMIAMSQCLLLATRPRPLEPLFGGLDRMYQLHKWLGITALGTLLLHDLLEPHFKRWAQETMLGEFGGSLGSLAYYGLVSLILLSWIKRIPIIGWDIPYHLWWLSHRLTGAFFAVACLHQILVDKPFGFGHPLSLILNISGATGIACYVFIEFIAARWRRRPYRVEGLTTKAGATHLSLRPVGRAMRWQPGQFAFLSAPDAGMNEPHPFTIAGKMDHDRIVHFMVKPLGDWTRRLPLVLRAGTMVRVEGPYGRFDFRRGGKRQVWVAGGVGITPFLAWAQSLSEDDERLIHLFYCVRTEAEAIGLDIVKDVAAHLPGFTFHLFVDAQGMRLDAKEIVERSPFDPNEADVFFCGPTGLRNAILRDFTTLGIKPRRIWFELFEFR